MALTHVFPTTNPLVERARAGDHGAFTELVKRHEGKVYKLALRLTGNSMDAMDVIQDVFVSVFQKIHTFRGTAAFSSWLYSIAANASFAMLNQRRRAAAVSLDDALPVVELQSTELHTEWSRKPDAVLLNKEAREVLERAINSLPGCLRTVVVLRDVQRLSNREVAEMLNLSIPALKSRLHRARLLLRRKLGGYLESRRPASRSTSNSEVMPRLILRSPNRNGPLKPAEQDVRMEN